MRVCFSTFPVRTNFHGSAWTRRSTMREGRAVELDRSRIPPFHPQELSDPLVEAPLAMRALIGSQVSAPVRPWPRICRSPRGPESRPRSAQRGARCICARECVRAIGGRRRLAAPNRMAACYDRLDALLLNRVSWSPCKRWRAGLYVPRLGPSRPWVGEGSSINMVRCRRISAERLPVGDWVELPPGGRARRGGGVPRDGDGELWAGSTKRVSTAESRC
jgi:hypothetical protein